MAAFIKREFDKRFGATWHVVVGKSFGSYCVRASPFPSSMKRVVERLTFFWCGALVALESQTHGEFGAA